MPDGNENNRVFHFIIGAIVVAVIALGYFAFAEGATPTADPATELTSKSIEVNAGI